METQNADDMAAGANTLEELFEIYKALVKTLAKAGIQIKSSKVEFGVEEITFHNYRVIGHRPYGQYNHP
jgi:hypothetical protein